MPTQEPLSNPDSASLKEEIIRLLDESNRLREEADRNEKRAFKLLEEIRTAIRGNNAAAPR